MDQLQEWGDRLLASLQEAVQTLIASLPSLVFAIVIVLGGWLIARLFRYLAVRAIYRIDWLFGASTVHSESAHRALTKAIAATVFWAIFLTFIAAAFGSLEIEVIDDWTSLLLGYIPVLLGGLLIVFFSVFVGNLARQVVEPAAESMGFGNSQFIGRFTQVAVVLTGAVIGTSVLGIDVTFVVQLTTVVVGVALAGLSFALALGIRGHLANVVGVRYAQKHLSPGDIVRIGDHEGRIIKFDDGFVFLEAAQGDISIPGSQVSLEPIIRLTDEPASGR